MAVMDPLKVRIANWDPEKFPSVVQVPDFPTDPTKTATHKVPFEEIVYIDHEDFREVRNCFLWFQFVLYNQSYSYTIFQTADKNFKRFTRNQSVGLKHVGVVLTVKDLIKVDV